uniref:Chaperone DnaJ n=1 Tax=Steinernema glaseri TaxID=37863 RepID=A0A1I8A7X9_9BILA
MASLITRMARSAQVVNSVRAISTTAYLDAKDYYKILGLKKDSSAKDIKKAYYKLAKEYHPDVNKGKDAAEKFQEVSEAYEVLSDEGKRAQYDQFGTDPFGGRSTAGAHPGAGAAGNWNFNGDFDPFKIFRDFDMKMRTGGGFAESMHGFGSTQQTSINISFEEACRGGNKTIPINVVDDCGKCRGSGTEPGYKKVSCPYCNGTGFTTQHIQGFFMQTNCSHCRGSGAYNKNPCIECEGLGQSVQRRQVTIQVPAGIDNGQTVRVRVGKGDVYITFNVAESLRFRREHDNIHCDVEISVAQAMLGGTVKVPGIYEDTNIHIPPGTSSHTRMKLSGKGIKRLNHHGRGDQYINIKVRIPKRLTERQKALIQAWAELETDTPGTVAGIRKTGDGLKKTVDGEESELISKIRELLDESVNAQLKKDVKAAETDKKPEEEPKKTEKETKASEPEKEMKASESEKETKAPEPEKKPEEPKKTAASETEPETAKEPTMKKSTA